METLPNSSSTNQSTPQAAKFAVFGGGSFGTALAHVVSKSPFVTAVTIFTRNEKVINSINNQNTNSEYVVGFTLSKKINASSNIDEVLKGANYVIHAIPVQSSREFLAAFKDKIPKDLPIISSSKGICTQSLQLMTDIIPEALEDKGHPCAFLSGPSFAKELLSNAPTGFVLASNFPNLTNTLLPYFNSRDTRVYTSDDVLGVELGGALKNIFAIAAGICTGMGQGMNSKSMLVTRGISEMTRIALKLGAKPETLAGLSGIGDLMLTCYGTLSRNLSVGMRLGKGESIADILASMEEVAEGVATTPAAVAVGRKYNIKIPIIETVNEVLLGQKTAAQAVEYLMHLPTGPEAEYTSIVTFSEDLSPKQ